MTSQTPPPQPTHITPDSPPVVKNVHSNFFYQRDILADARLAVLQDLGGYIPMIPLQKFLDFLTPPCPHGFNLAATMQSLKSGSAPVLTSENRWSMFLDTPKDIKASEDEIFKAMPEIFKKVMLAIIANSGGQLNDLERTIDFLQNPTRSPSSAVRRNESRPDGYFVLRNRDKKTSKDGKGEDILWSDIALSCEYKRGDGSDDLNDVRIHQGSLISRAKLIYHIRTSESAYGACNTSCETICVVERHLALPSKIPRQECGSAAAPGLLSANRSILSMYVLFLKKK